MTMATDEMNPVETAPSDDADYVIDFTRDTIAALLAEPEVAVFRHAVSGDSILLTVRASRQECGRVIGREGVVIKAINVLCNAVARKNNCYITIDIRNNDDKADEAKRG